MTPAKRNTPWWRAARACGLVVVLAIACTASVRAEEPVPAATAEPSSELAAVAVATVPAPATPPLPPASVRAWQTGLLRPDRLQHASLAFSSGFTVGVITGKPAVAAGGALALGLLKELWDAQRGRGFDWVDLAADGIGAVFAAGATTTLEPGPK